MKFVYAHQNLTGSTKFFVLGQILESEELMNKNISLMFMKCISCLLIFRHQVDVKMMIYLLNVNLLDDLWKYLQIIKI